MSKRAKLEQHEDLECPICTKHLLPPVYQCHEGHLLCEDCVEKTQNICPTCKDRMPPQKIRNRAIEDIIRGRKHPCRNYEEGCRERLKFDALDNHKFDCLYSYLPFCNWLRIGDSLCRQIVMMKNFKDHCEREHGIIWSGERSLGEEFKMVENIPRDRVGSCPRWGAFSLRRPSGIPLFVMVKVAHSHKLTSWLPMIVGTPETADLYNCKITLTGKVKMSWEGDWLSLLSKEDRASCFTVSAECLGRIIMGERQNNSYEITVLISARETASN